MTDISQFIITPKELAANIAQYKIIDGSWYLPVQDRDAKAEYAAARIPGAVYFDIDTISDASSDLPHMLPSPDAFATAMSNLGINEKDTIIVYDGVGIFSAAGVWWTLRVMGAKSVKILQGGFDRWKEAGYSVEIGTPNAIEKTAFNVDFDSTKVRNLSEIKHNLKSGKDLILDARPYKRFIGETPEPRAGLRSGHIPGSVSLPITELLKDGTLLSISQLKSVFENLKISQSTPVITSCGSGVTAAIISLALESVGHENHSLYDGSWSEWGAQQDVPVASWRD